MITARSRTLLLTASLLLTGCSGGAVATTHATPATPAEKAAGEPGETPAHNPAETPAHAPAPADAIPGLGPRTLAQIPPTTRQALVVTGRDRDSPDSTVVLYRRTATGWTAGPAWPAHNALRGWSGHHMLDDLRSPVGVFTLHDAGGLLADPGTKLPYHRSGKFTAPGTGFEGESLAGSFDYVVAIDYNRDPGTSPLDADRPLGARRGGGIWLHVDHGGPTHGCVGLSEEHMRDLLRALDPAWRPVIVMGDRASLAV
ncbi:L,D-transpeptidase family protein [Streptomyces roseirectus]|uniref:L,D-transpeptidase family protein n=1 Tax=Streptomyces roseirectus TaxID=2768066 RepID=A0A7H0I6P1_9ACTN|nr:L,D-transpeptidase family protein [Streptomyces roseirectus]QNP68457.1 L,D-transpeptidase family protein [Streptomyces roseirectus]